MGRVPHHCESLAKGKSNYAVLPDVELGNGLLQIAEATVNQLGGGA
jgi:hypothetical protein